MDAGKIHLVLFLSRATSLDRWNKSGILERELRYYRELKNQLGSLSIVSPGGKEDKRYLSKMVDITLLNNSWHLPPNLYSLCAPFLHWPVLHTADVFKTNQLDGAWTAVFAGRLFQKPVIVRAGYLWSEFVRREQGQGVKARIIESLEGFSLSKSSSIFVTTEKMRARLMDEFRFGEEKITVIPNYVDTELFRPIKPGPAVKGRICFIGRLHPQKNLKELILAASEIPDCSLVVVGEGHQRMELEKLAREIRVPAQFTGVIENSQLPALINSCQIFIMPSLYEGHPKALIEAMACGIPVVGTAVPGITELITHGQNGLVCSPDRESLREAMQKLLFDEELQKRLGENARKFSVEYFSLPRIIELEIATISSVVDQYGRH